MSTTETTTESRLMAFLAAKREAERQGRVDTAYLDGLEAIIPMIQRDALRAAWDAMLSPAASHMGTEGSHAACHQIERVAREMGVRL